ncbi:substance-K receptor-like [Ornithodoros turicata]|uniref:substance-K receptor-like n=1 Tax=Ornithodoros turicata TaxID=34597 RepID=UPI0031395D27
MSVHPNCSDILTSVVNLSLLEDAGPLARAPLSWWGHLKICVFVLTMTVSVLGNSGVILTVALNRSLRTTINYYLMNLAVADTIISVFCMWVHLVNHLFDWYVLGPFMCKVEGFTQMTTVTCSVLTLSAISCDRFSAILFPFHTRVTKQRTGGVLVSVWLVSAAVASPLLLYSTPYTVQWSLDESRTYCGDSWPQTITWDGATCMVRSPSKQLYYAAVTVALFFVPVAVMSSAYALIIITLWKERQPPGEHSPRNIHLHSRAKRKVVKLVCVVMVVFVLCWMPFQVLVLFSQFRDNDGDPLPLWFSGASFWCTYLAYANSALNPIIYGGMAPNFRQGLANALRCGQKRVVVNHTRRWSSRLTVTTGGSTFPVVGRARPSAMLHYQNNAVTPPTSNCSSRRLLSTGV